MAKKEVVHARAGAFAITLCRAGVRGTTKRDDVTCKRCLFIMLCNGEIPTTDPRVTDDMRKRGGFNK